VNIFSEGLIHLSQVEEIENFFKMVYEACIIMAEKKFGAQGA
jgi:hypothetical protein